VTSASTGPPVSAAGAPDADRDRRAAGTAGHREQQPRAKGLGRARRKPVGPGAQAGAAQQQAQAEHREQDSRDQVQRDRAAGQHDRHLDEQVARDGEHSVHADDERGDRRHAPPPAGAGAAPVLHAAR